MRHWRNAGLVLAMAFALSIVAAAQDYRGYGYQNGNVAEQNAYSLGVQQGQMDRSSGRKYNDRDGSSRVQKEYRGIFAQGYRVGYENQRAGVWGRDGDRDRDHDRDDRWRYEHNNGPYNGPVGTPGAYGYRGGNPAYQYGYKDGYDLGANDARRGAAYNDHGSGAYKHADNGFPGGNKGQYQQEYRQAYLEGYRSGWDTVRRGGYGYRR